MIISAQKNITTLLLSVLIALSTFSGIFRLPSTIYVVVVFLFFLCYIVLNKLKIKVGYYELPLFVLICLFSILYNKPAYYFRVWERLALFLLVLFSFSPIITSSILDKKRFQLFETLLWVMMAYAFSSFFAYFLGINYFVRDGEMLDMSDAGHFSGFTNHSMMLAPISAMSSLYAFSNMLNYIGTKKKMLRWLGVFFVCFGSLLLSASRGAVGSAVFGIMIIMYRYSSGHIFKAAKYLIFVVAIAAATFPLWGSLSSAVIEKNDYNESQGGVMYSRESKMAARIYEIENNFLTGVGFATVDETVDGVDRAKGTIEPNSSWLGVFSMTGFFGFLLFLFVNIRAIRDAYKRINNRILSSLMCGLLSFFFIHMVIEGYVLAGGSILCGLYWLTISTTYALANEKSKVVTK